MADHEKRIIELEAEVAKLKHNFALIIEALERAAKKPRTKKAAAPTEPPASTQLWNEYEAGFKARYGHAPPARNARVNAQFTQLAKNVGLSDACDLVHFYLRNSDAFYVREGHPVGLLVRDYHRLMVDMTRGRSLTMSEAREMESAAGSIDTATDFLRRKHAPFPKGD